MRNQTANSDRHIAGAPESGVAMPAKAKPVVETKTKIAVLHKLLSRPRGATVAQIQNCLIWQPHSVRAAISRLRTSGVRIEIDQSGKVARYRAMPMEAAQ
ncbi:DUF3489 domain-containing protein [Sulfitobacter mediterraneus]|uniref:DUF3489 domain-containing protein n=1 Tax=Sulfitobacter mediterraneus TaxID=83219 RepID=UPI0013C48FD0|nr:DUF3489 domain-containing protein [Sulfitobacter mediterraneus]